MAESCAQRSDLKPGETAGLPRRLGAMCYDALLVLALWFFATFVLMPFTHGEAITPGNHLFLTWLLFVAFLFYGWFWTHGGQTLGMRAWRLRVVQRDGAPLTWKKALLRYLCALVSLAAGGLGFLWVLVDRERLAWHDRWSRTRIVRI